MALEHEVKLPFATLEAARQAVLTAGGRLVRSRRLLDDRLFDTADGQLRAARSALRVRRDGDRASVTWKGHPHGGPVKSREEIETGVADPSVLIEVLERLGYQTVFRGQKYREDFEIDGATVVVDETPFGVFVEIETAPDRIEPVARRLGRSPADYRLESYPHLWRTWCVTNGLPETDMVFGDTMDG